MRELANRSGLLPANATVCLAPCAVPANLTGPPSDFPAKTDGTIRILTGARIHPRKGQLQVAQALAMLPVEMRREDRVPPGWARAMPLTSDRSKPFAGRQRFGVSFLVTSMIGHSRRFISGARFTRRPARPCRAVSKASGISLLEAGYYGCPVAAFASGGVGEAVQEGRSALLVSEGDVVGLSMALGRICCGASASAAVWSRRSGACAQFLLAAERPNTNGFRFSSGQGRIYQKKVGAGSPPSRPILSGNVRLRWHGLSVRDISQDSQGRLGEPAPTFLSIGISGLSR